MKKIRNTLIFLFTITGISAYPQSPEIIKIRDLQEILNSDNDTLYIINFWATWCMPCVKELPCFEKINKEKINKKVKVVLISLDFKRHLNNSVIPLLVKQKIKSEVFLLDEPDHNSWINIIDESWQGSIPATLFFQNKARFKAFYEKSFTCTELDEILNNIQNKLQ